MRLCDFLIENLLEDMLQVHVWNIWDLLLEVFKIIFWKVCR